MLHSPGFLALRESCLALRVASSLEEELDLTRVVPSTSALRRDQLHVKVRTYTRFVRSLTRLVHIIGRRLFSKGWTMLVVVCAAHFPGHDVQYWFRESYLAARGFGAKADRFRAQNISVCDSSSVSVCGTVHRVGR